ncbi:MAG: hypothetical protein H8E27_01270 [Verrucomicrobia subdivision 3 bacterium]|nr:hypothetical protein [Limisphaerales bacterium]
MKKILLTLVALVALTWNVNAQGFPNITKYNQPPQDSNKPPEIGLFLESETGLPLDLYGLVNVDFQWGFTWDMESLLMAHMLETKTDKLTLKFFPYYYSFGNQPAQNTADYYLIDIAFEKGDTKTLVFNITKADALPGKVT